MSIRFYLKLITGAKFDDFEVCPINVRMFLHPGSLRKKGLVLTFQDQPLFHKNPSRKDIPRNHSSEKVPSE